GESTVKQKSLTFTPNLVGDTIKRNDAGNWLTDGFAVGDLIAVTGSPNNSRVFSIASLTADTLTLTAQNVVTAETLTATVADLGRDIQLNGVARAIPKRAFVLVF